jgi:hypothetical protein
VLDETGAAMTVLVYEWRSLSWTINWFHVDRKLSISELAKMALTMVMASSEKE